MIMKEKPRTDAGTSPGPNELSRSAISQGIRSDENTLSPATYQPSGFKETGAPDGSKSSEVGYADGGAPLSREYGNGQRHRQAERNGAGGMALTADELTAIRVTLTAARLFNQPMPDQAAWRYLEQAGVDLNAICDLASPIVCANGSIDDGSFTFDPLGEAFLVTSVLGEDAETTVDLVGWSAREPEKFGSMYRTCGVLGIDQLLNPATYVDGAPCLIWRTPLNWLRAGCKGAVILDADMAKIRSELHRACWLRRHSNMQGNWWPLGFCPRADWWCQHRIGGLHDG